MAGRKPRRFKGSIRTGTEFNWEWIGFASAGTFGNLDTTIVHELIPPIADDTVGIQSFTVHRIVGNVTIRHQSGVLTNNALGIMVGVEGAGADQTSDNPLLPITQDLDALAHRGMMFWWAGQPEWKVDVAQSDLGGYIVPIDIRVKRIVRKRERLVLTMQAATTARLTALVNVRALIRESAGS